jgi:hypothetical protein
MSEASMWQIVKKAIIKLDPQRVENACGMGMPDVNYIDGWIELKWVRDVPKRKTTPLRIEHYTPEQRVWALRRIAAGGKVFLLLKAKDEWFLFDGGVAAQYLNKSTLEELRKVAIRTWVKKLNGVELKIALL